MCFFLAALKGFQSRDIVRLGDYSVEAKFGSITDCNSPDFNGVDGIAGFGKQLYIYV